MQTLTMWLMWLTVVVLAVSTWFWWKRLKESKLNEPPGPRGLPIVGYLPFLDRKRMNLTFIELAKKYGDVFQLRMGSIKMVVVNGQRAIRQFYKKPTDFLDKPDWFTSRMAAATVDSYLFTPFSLRYWIHKKLLFTAMKRFLAERSREIEEAVHKIVRMAVDEAKKRNRQSFDPEILCSQIACALTFYHTYGRLPKLGDREVKEAVQINFDSVKTTAAISKCNVIPWMRFLPTMWKPIDTYKTAFRLYRDYMDKFTVASIDKYDGITQRCFIDFLCYAAAQLDDEDNSILVDDRDLMIKKITCNVSFFGALTPLTIAVKWVIFLAALHPNVQKKVRDEISQKIGKDRQPSLQDEDMLPYTTAAFREIIRYTSMAALGVPKSTTCDTELDGYFIPKGTAVTANLYSASRDGTVFPDPDTFDPQRFLNPDGTLKADAYKDVIEMGLGPRRCGGGQLWWLEMYTFFASLMQCCHIEQVPGSRLDPTDYYFEVGLHPSSFKVVMY